MTLSLRKVSTPASNSSTTVSKSDSGSASNTSTSSTTTSANKYQAVRSQDTFQSTSSNQSTRTNGSQSVNPNGPPEQARSGAEAAARLDPEKYHGGADDPRRAREFAETVKAHQNDPQFLKDLYANLGKEDSKRLLNNAVLDIRNDNQNDYRNDAEVKATLSALARSVNSMPVEAQRELGRAAAQGSGGPEPLVDILSQPGAPRVAKEAFLDTAKGLALGNDYYKIDHARAIGNVLASDASLFQSYVDKWGSDLTSIMKTGLEIPAPALSGSFHSYEGWPSLRNDGIERLIGMAGALPKGEKYDTFRAQIFRDASSVLGEVKTGDRLHQPLVENLKTLYMADSRNILERLFNNRGSAAGDTGFDPSQKALGLFLREAAFARPNPNDPFLGFISNQMGDLRSRMLDPRNTNAKPDNHHYAKLLGDLVGSLGTGYTLAVKDNVNQQAANEAMVKSIVGLFGSQVKADGTVASIAKDKAQELATKFISDLVNSGLKKDKESMTKLMDRLLQESYAGVRDFDDAHKTHLETTFKSEVTWVDFVRRLFEN